MDSLPQDHTARNDIGMGKATPDCDTSDLPGFAPAEAANDMRMSQLARAIEEQIIPRLMLAHRSCPSELAPVVDADGQIAEHEVLQFAKLVLANDEDLAFTAIQALRARQVAVEKIYLDLLAPTARYLGELWENDLCTFTDVTIGLGRLQRMLRELSPALGSGVAHPRHGRRVLLLPSPGEQHTFGLVMVGEFFRRAGWDVTGGAWAPRIDAAKMVATEWFDVVGYSLGSEVHVQALADSIESIRRATCNRDLAVLVGGPLFVVHPEFVDRVDADGMTIDGREAPALAEALIVRKVGTEVPRQGSHG